MWMKRSWAKRRRRVVSWRTVLAIIASGFVSSLTDWLFMGDWLYKRFDRHPEIWRYSSGTSEGKAIVWSSLLPFLTCGVFILLCEALHLHSYRETLKLAAAIWLIGPLCLIITYSVWMKIDGAIAASYSMGWLVKLVIAAGAVTNLLK